MGKYIAFVSPPAPSEAIYSTMCPVSLSHTLFAFVLEECSGELLWAMMLSTGKGVVTVAREGSAASFLHYINKEEGPGNSWQSKEGGRSAWMAGRWRWWSGDGFGGRKGGLR